MYILYNPNPVHQLVGDCVIRASPMVAGNSYNNGYSGHSIKDRMFQRLEQMLPEAQNENERQLIHQYMRKLDSE